jgi:biopolymer transport protein ExbD
MRKLINHLELPIQTSVQQFMINTQDRKYQKIKGEVKRFIRKNKKIDHLTILNSLKIDYDTLMRILDELKSKGNLK